MNNSENDNKEDDLPTFSGNQMPRNITLVDEAEIGEETTRRVQGAFIPSFAPLNTISSPPSVFGADISTGISKITSPSSEQITKATPKAATVVVKAALPIRGAWKLKYAPSVPSFGHPLDPTAVFVPHTNATIMAQRVSSILQERNIQASYKKSQAECLTLDNVEFNVCLYQGKNEYNHGVIVEVQRFNGNSAAFYDDAKAILNGAKDENYRLSKLNVPLPIVEEDDNGMADDISSLNSALKMLQGSEDTQLLGLQLLSSITNAEKMGTKVASAASVKLASSESELLNKIFEIVANTEESSEEESTSLIQAMILLSNIAISTTLPTEDIRSTLTSLVASDKPQIAYLAAKCFASDQIDSVVANALQSAEKLGQEKHHSGLCALSNNLLQKCI